MKIIKKHIKDIKSFTIPRSIWARGNVERRNNTLLNKDGSMCCLGVYLKQCGISNNKLLEISMPAELIENLPITKGEAWLANYKQKPIEDISLKTKLTKKEFNTVYNSVGSEQLAEDNDDNKISEEIREKKIRNGFAKLGIKVRFVD